MVSDELELRFARLVEADVDRGADPDFASAAAGRPDLEPELRALFARYRQVSARLDASTPFDAGDRPPGDEPTTTHSDDEAAGAAAVQDAPASPTRRPPPFAGLDGFETIERLGSGGMGEVYKLRDLTLNRFVAAKVVRADRRAQTALGAFLSEARALALFADPRIVRIFEFRQDADPPVIVMEYVEGFELGRVGPSLDDRQKARVIRDVASAVQHAHGVGLQHRDLKPSNIMLDASLTPKILDFGLSARDPTHGHFRGTLHYLAPEQLDPSQPIDARTDVYALGVILYRLLTGVVPYDAADTADVLDAIRHAAPRLPVELDASVPAPLQAVALKAMERRPADRYQSAGEMAQDLDRYLHGLPVLAQPTQYAATLDARVQPHLNQLAEWERVRLIYPHEADRLRTAYGRLFAREDDWIASSRALSYSQIALYLGAALLLAGSLFYFTMQLIDGAASGLLWPVAALALPFAGLNAGAMHLYRTERKAVGVAFFLAAVALLPVFLLVAFHELHWLTAPPNAPGQFFDDGTVSNHQLQLTLALTTAWAGWLAFRTKTSALSVLALVLLMTFALAVLTDVGLREWLDDNRADLLALHVAPMIVVYAALAAWLERTHRRWLATPSVVAAAVTVVLVLDLLANDGRAFAYLGVTLQGLQSPHVDSKTLIDTMGALSLNGVVFYMLASALDRSRSDATSPAASFLFVIAPFSTLEPIGYLVEKHDYSIRFDWLFLVLAVSAAIVSHHRQRKNFFYAGLINTGFGLYFLADHEHWFTAAWWPKALIAVGLAALAGGFLLDARERRRGT